MQFKFLFKCAEMEVFDLRGNYIPKLNALIFKVFWSLVVGYKGRYNVCLYLWVDLVMREEMSPVFVKRLAKGTGRVL